MNGGAAAVSCVRFHFAHQGGVAVACSPPDEKMRTSFCTAQGDQRHFCDHCLCCALQSPLRCHRISHAAFRLFVSQPQLAWLKELTPEQRDTIFMCSQFLSIPSHRSEDARCLLVAIGVDDDGGIILIKPDAHSTLSRLEP
jgi:hypothetical protein